MIENAVKTLWKQNKPVLNGWLAMPCSFSSEIAAAAGFDSLCIDMQHGLVDYAQALPMLQAMRASGVVPFCRVPWLDPAPIMKMLDAGAYGVICPMISSAEQAEQFVSYMRYPPRGQRSYGPTRANYSAGNNYATEANDQVLALAMIETKEAIANLDAIVRTPGLDGVYIGPSDLSLGVSDGKLGARQDRREPEMIKLIKEIQRKAADQGIAAGIHTASAEYAAEAIGWGFNFVTVGGDSVLLAMALKQRVATVRSLLGQTVDQDPNQNSAY